VKIYPSDFELKLGFDQIRTKLENAIYLYRKYGFTEVPFGSSAYKRSNIKMEVTI